MSHPHNVLFLLSDEHNRDVTGCHGHPFVRTPNIDALAARGTRFDAAYCNSPICVPSRAALATGRPVHETGHWDNAHPYDGTPRSWHHLLRDAGVDVVSVGKLHFRGTGDHGFTEELLPLHVVDGKGDLKGLFRRDLPPRSGNEALAEKAGPGHSSYCAYDERIAAAAADWLDRRAAAPDAGPFVLFVSFVMPHFPLIAPPESYALYEALDLDTLRQGLVQPAVDHPTLNRMRAHFDYDRFFDDAARARALRAYFGMVTRMDALLGEVVTALERNGFADTTQIVYTSDHGDNLGNRGMWGKSVMYEDLAAVPMILAGPGIATGAVCTTPVSLLDLAPTLARSTGVDDRDAGFGGTALQDIARGAEPDRAILSEYHAAGSDTAMFMLRKRNWKLVYYVGAPPQLFDLDRDPDEAHDLARDPASAARLEELLADLRARCDPEAVSARAFADQAALIEAEGGQEGIAAAAEIPFTPAPA